MFPLHHCSLRNGIYLCITSGFAMPWGLVGLHWPIKRLREKKNGHRPAFNHSTRNCRQIGTPKTWNKPNNNTKRQSQKKKARTPPTSIFLCNFCMTICRALLPEMDMLSSVCRLWTCAFSATACAAWIRAAMPAADRSVGWAAVGRAVAMFAERCPRNKTTKTKGLALAPH